ncbi:MAG: YlxR family protein [Deltaproteobacteria bacterium]|nr:YlxR family protein [Deltaproteobacteria bacterium]
MSPKRDFPVRMCIACRRRKSRDELRRFVCLQGNRVEWDVKKVLPGRGAYVCPDRACLDHAVRRQLFERSFGVCVDASDIPERIDLGGFLDAKNQSVRVG